MTGTTSLRMSSHVRVTGTREKGGRTVVGMLQLDAPPGGSLRVPMSLADFEQLHTDVRVEWYDGICLVNPPLRRHVVCAMRITDLLRTACPPGYRVYAEWGWRAGDSLFRPDLMIAPVEGPADVQREAPLLVVEVLSPGTRDTDLGRKRELYAAGGLLCYWVVDPESGAVDVYGGAGLPLIQTIVDEPTTTVGAIVVLLDPTELAAL